MDEQPGLPVATCPACGLNVVPQESAGCPRCTTHPLVPRTLPPTGTVWAFTVQRYAPKSPPYVPPPGGFSPFVVAYVQMSDGSRVEGIVEQVSPDEVAIGQPVRFVSCVDVPRFVPADSTTSTTGTEEAA